MASTPAGKRKERLTHPRHVDFSILTSVSIYKLSSDLIALRPNDASKTFPARLGNPTSSNRLSVVAVKNSFKFFLKDLLNPLLSDFNDIA